VGESPRSLSCTSSSSVQWVAAVTGWDASAGQVESILKTT
jgi:hypothetical protein